MITAKEQAYLDGLKAHSETGCHAEDRLVYLDLLLKNPRQEICDAIDPELVTRAFIDYAKRFRNGTVGGDACTAAIDRILETGHPRLIDALPTERHAKSPFALRIA